ncbi:putative mitochondrial protein [Cucumis melo var. makuwa]|uniref:Mitochondrial protein n=1 Tax=Cucumis melo var. makuwa TaxID=1194695 RepID=A0A5D3BVQ8_CUCMM|nr:putative mitochondrial protein [Cucumis melo var. makuwa]TYK02326.1 putative mitochondrial protein [Cucumis melo var. makuwa]
MRIAESTENKTKLDHLGNIGHKTVRCKWVFTLKYKADGTLYRHKVRGTIKDTLITLCSQVSKTRKIVVLIIYVDDIVLFGDHTIEITKLKKKMRDEFQIKDLGNLKYFLRIEAARSRKGISMFQRKYTLDLLAKTGTMGCHPADMPIKFNVKLENSSDRIPIDKEKYQHLVGQLTYLTLGLTSPMLAISLLGEVRSKELWLEAALKSNTGP